MCSCLLLQLLGERQSERLRAIGDWTTYEVRRGLARHVAGTYVSGRRGQQRPTRAGPLQGLVSERLLFPTCDGPLPDVLELDLT